MSTLEDKILGEKREYYCDSSSDDGEAEANCHDREDEKESDVPGMSTTGTNFIKESTSEPRAWDGTSVNTGPKGVLKDWQRYKQLQAERREQNEAERRALVKKLSLTCRSQLDDEKEKKLQNETDTEIDKEIAEILEDDFFKKYLQKRMNEIISSTQNLPKFGHLLTLDNADAILEAVDKEMKEVPVIIHLYEDGASGCAAMNGCLQCLAQDYPQVKFCRLRASVAGVTNHFKISGVPALLVYRGGTLVGNFVRLTDELGDDFYADSVESFLIEHGILPDKTLVPELIRQSQTTEDSDGCSDFDVD